MSSSAKKNTWFESADRDGDSRLAVYEFVDARFYNFRDADTDSSGTLSEQEVVDAFNR